MTFSNCRPGSFLSAACRRATDSVAIINVLAEVSGRQDSYCEDTSQKSDSMRRENHSMGLSG